MKVAARKPRAGTFDKDEFTKLYEQTEYERGPDIKRNHALEAVTQAAPQTHTHGEQKVIKILGWGFQCR
jgi:hypothetical protein